MSQHAPWDPAHAREIIDRLKDLDGAALPMFHALQEAFGYVDRAILPEMAEALNISRAELHGTLSFYHDFKDKPYHGRVIKLCRAEACQAMGCEDLVDIAAREHGLMIDGSDAGASARLETVYCLGNCALGPAALVDGALIGRLDAARLAALCRGAAIADVLTTPESSA